MNIKVVGKAVLIDPDGKILLLRRSKTDTRRPLQWDIPGGAVEPGEPAEKAIAREILEETSIHIDSLRLQLIWADADAIFPADEQVPMNLVWLIYRITVPSAIPKLSYEHDRFAWVRPEQAVKQIEYQRQANMLAYAVKYKLLEP